jgi:hypothetical protein
VSPLGIVKLKVAAEDVPTLVTVADEPADPVVTVPTWMVAAAPGVPAWAVKLMAAEGMPVMLGWFVVKLPPRAALLKVALNCIVIG